MIKQAVSGIGLSLFSIWLGGLAYMQTENEFGFTYMTKEWAQVPIVLSAALLFIVGIVIAVRSCCAPSAEPKP